MEETQAAAPQAPQEPVAQPKEPQDEAKAQPEEPKPEEAEGKQAKKGRKVKYKGKEVEISPEEEPEFIQKGMLFHEKNVEIDRTKKELEAARAAFEKEKAEARQLFESFKENPFLLAQALNIDLKEIAKQEAQWADLPDAEKQRILQEIEFERTRKERDELKNKFEAQQSEKTQAELIEKNYQTAQEVFGILGEPATSRALFHMAAIQVEALGSGVELDSKEIAAKMAEEEKGWMAERTHRIPDPEAEAIMEAIVKRLGPEKVYARLSKAGLLDNIQAQTLKALGRERPPEPEARPKSEPAKRMLASDFDREWKKAFGLL